MVTNVYVDGFNLYYGCLKGTPYKWLDLGTLCQALLPPNKIQRIRYFTAKISAQADPQGPVRQSTYLRALQTVPGLTVRCPLPGQPELGYRLRSALGRRMRHRSLIRTSGCLSFPAQHGAEVAHCGVEAVGLLPGLDRAPHVWHLPVPWNGPLQ